MKRSSIAQLKVAGYVDVCVTAIDKALKISDEVHFILLVLFQT